MSTRASVGLPDSTYAVSDAKHFYMIDVQRPVACLHAKTGKALWGPKRTAPGIVSDSPAGDGQLYLLNENYVTIVVAAGPAFTLLATNELEGSDTHRDIGS